MQKNKQKPENKLNASGIGSIPPSLMIRHVNDSKRLSKSNNLRMILSTREKVKKMIATNIEFAKPLITHNGKPVIFQRTINGMQGQAGSHKSRLAEIILALQIKKGNCENDFLGFEITIGSETITGVYVDSERNLSEQFPYAMQSIQLKAGFSKTDQPENFEFISLLQVKRKERFGALNEFLNYMRTITSNPLFVVLDVATDCIEDFNRSDKSLELIDLMNMAINEYDVTFLCIIHENPNSEKARGHFGTELMNKASTFLKVGFEKDSRNEDTDIIKVKYLKCRSSAKHPPLYLKYSEETKGLVLADSEEVVGVINNRRQTALIDDVIEFIEGYLGNGVSLAKSELIENLCEKFKASTRTIESRLKEILEEKHELINAKGELCILKKEKEGKETNYTLKQVGNDAEDNTINTIAS